MANDMDVSAATFGTAGLLLESDDEITGATGYGWGTAVANNTGWLRHQPRNVHQSITTIVRSEDADKIVGYVWMPDGTYSWYGQVDADVAPEVDAYLKVDGTTLVTWTNADATTGSVCGWINDAGARWVAIRLTGSADSDPITVLCAIAYRNGSFAP